MKVLLIKTSSMGDIIHTFPALTDAARAIPDIQFHWVVENAFVSLPSWHAQVNKVIPVSLRQWRKDFFSQKTWAEWRELRSALNNEQYDLILDAQGLIKSAFLLFFTKGKRAGLDWGSAREPLASLAYHQKHTVNFYQHAIVRMRSLFSLALGYTLPDSFPDFGLAPFQHDAQTEKYLVFIFGTTWKSKQWPENYWVQLADLAGECGYRIKISGHDEEERACAQRIASQSKSVEILPRLTIAEMGNILANAKGVVSVDTGFGHLAAAMNVPVVSIYGATDPAYTRPIGKQAVALAAQFPCSPCLNRQCTFKGTAEVTPACYSTVTPQQVWEALMRLLSLLKPRQK